MSIIELLQELIQRPSITPYDAGCQQLISERLKNLSFHCETLRFGEVENLWARRGTHAPLFVFAGHTDVVPPGPEADWVSPPFQPTLRENYLYGRGASDMKGALAVMVVAVEQFIKKYPHFMGSIGFLLTSDEEGPALNGTRKVMEVLTNRGEKIDYCLIGEPSSETILGDQIRIGRRGSLHAKLIIHGKQGHVAHPHLAKNPIHLSAKALHELAHTEWDQGDEHFPPTTFQLTNIHGGTGAANVIPGHLEILFNFRFSTALTISALQAKAESILQKHNLAYDIQWEIAGEPFFTQQNILLSATELAIKEVTGLSTKLSTGGGTSDGRFIAPTGTNLVELGVSHATAHHVNECVKIDDLFLLSNIYIKILEILFQVSEPTK